MEDLFNLNPENFTNAAPTRKVDENIYDPSPDQGQNGTYKAIIRFIPWASATDARQSRYQKYSAKLVNPLTNEKLYIDCPSTIGAPSILWQVDSAIKELSKEEPAIADELKKYFNRYYHYYSCVYIKKDPQHPELDGTIKIMPYGYTIDNLIQQELNPESDLITAQRINPFSLLQGKDFVLVVKRKTKSWRDYSACKFLNEVTPLIITHNGKDIPVTNDQKVMEFTKNFLVQKSPDMTPYFYKEWTEADYEKVATFIKAIIPYKQILDSILAKTKDERIKKYFNTPTTQPQAQSISQDIVSTFETEFTPIITNTPKSKIITSQSTDFDNFPLDEPATVFDSPSSPSKSTMSTASELGSSLDDLLNEL